VGEEAAAEKGKAERMEYIEYEAKRRA